MSVIETISDVSNTFLARRELTCNFTGLGGKLKKSDAASMVSKEFKLGSKMVIPMRLYTHVGRSLVTGTFYVYDDETLAKKHINPTIFARLEKTAAKEAETAEQPVEANKEAKVEDAKQAEQDAAAEQPVEENKEAESK